MCVARTIAPPHPSSGQLGPCPATAVAATTLMRSVSVRRRCRLVICRSEQPSTPPFGSEGRVNHLVRNHRRQPEPPRLAPYIKPRPLVDTCGRVGAETATPESGFRPHHRSVKRFSSAPPHMRVARTIEPPGPLSGQLSPCPRPSRCDNDPYAFSFCSKALPIGDRSERAALNAPLRKRRPGQPFIPESHTSTRTAAPGAVYKATAPC